MDFFDRQDHARRQTRRLLGLFGLAVLVVVLVNNLLLCSFMACFRIHNPRYVAYGIVFNFFENVFYLLGEALTQPGHFLALIFHGQPVFWVTLGTLLSIGGGCYYKIRQLSEGGTVVAEFLGGRRVAAAPTSLEEQRLRHVVEEMAIASGMAVPEIYVLDAERGINTFAAGHTRHDVALGVTRGAVKLLSRDELQGVVAHEFSHILNGDTRLNMRLIGLAPGRWNF